MLTARANHDHITIDFFYHGSTVSVKGDELASVSMADAFGAGIEPRGAWYDEMLVRNDTVIVIGFS